MISRRSFCRRRHRCAVLAAFVIVAGFSPLPSHLEATEFLRGDFNGDGTVSVADVRAELSFMFLGTFAPTCLETGDVNLDGTIDIVDAIELLPYLVQAGPPPCEPFPDPGEAPGSPVQGCESYGGGSQLPDPAARLEVLDAAAGADGRASLVVLVSASSGVGGLSGVLSIESDIFSNGREGETTSLLLDGDGSNVATLALVQGERLRFVSIPEIVRPISVPAGDDTAVLEITVCIDEGTPPGEYVMTLEQGELADMESGRAVAPALAAGTLTVSAGSTGCPGLPDADPGTRDCSFVPDPPDDPPDDPPVDLPSLDFMRGDANTDGRISTSDVILLRRWFFLGTSFPTCLDATDVTDDGASDITDAVRILERIYLGGAAFPAPDLEIGPDPTADDLTCGEYTVVEPVQTDDVLRVESVTAAPGEEVDITVYLTNSVPVEAVQLLLAYDPELLTPLEDLVFEGTWFEGAELRGYAGASDPAGEGVLRVGFVPSFISDDLDVPPGEERPIFKIRAQVSADAPEGVEVFLEPTNGPDGAGTGPLGLKNELTLGGLARFASMMPRTVGGLLKISPDVIVFVRGDANMDLAVDMTDAIGILEYLFLGKAAPRCMDAADANDDGLLDISDPIAILETQFLGLARIPAPYPSSGRDETGDELTRCR